jgi:DNA-binding NtrC family response regulator
MAYLLIVDDDEDFANSVTTVLRKEGHDVQVELDTDDAVQSMENKPPDLVILDVIFPEDPSAGFEFVNTRFPLGFGPKDIDERWLPVTDFLEKPVDFDVLRRKVAKLLLEDGTAD